MAINDDFKVLYEDKCIQFDQISEQFNELQQQSTLIMNDLQDEIKQLKRKNELLQRQVKQLKQKKKYITSTIERQLDQAQKQKNQFKNRFKDFERKVIELQIINQNLQNQLRATRYTLDDYQTSTERTMQELAILRVELQQSTSSNQEQVARLKQQLKQTEQQIIVMHKKSKKFTDQFAQPISHHQNHRGPLKVKAQNPQRIQTIINQSPQNILQKHNQHQRYRPSNSTSSNFKQTLKQIRSYLQTIDSRKEEIKRTILMHKQYRSVTNV